MAPKGDSCMALFVSNPRDKHGRFKKGRKGNPTPHRRASGPAKTAAKRARRVVRAARKTAVAKVQNVSRRRRPNAPALPAINARRRRRKNLSALPTVNPAKQRRRRRKNGALVVVPRRRKYRRARNALTLSNPMSGIPILGTMVSMFGPALFGATGIEAIGQTLVLVRKVVEIPEVLAPYEFTLGGLVLAGVVQMLTFIPAPIRHQLGIGMASAGSAVDWFRYRSGSGAYGALEMGDGGEWRVQKMTDTEAYGALEMGNHDFAGDEDYCGDDFSVAEGTAAAEGYGAYHKKFPMRARNGRESAGWHWLAHMVGPEDFKRVANMPPEDRLRQIAACKQACRNAIRGTRQIAGGEAVRTAARARERFAHPVAHDVYAQSAF